MKPDKVILGKLNTFLKELVQVTDYREDRLNHKTKRYKKRPLNKIKNIVIHHTGNNQNKIRPHENWHVYNKDWPALGYHFFINYFGHIYLVNSIDYVTNHVRNNNTSSIGICLVGDFRNKKPTPYQMEAINILLHILSIYLPMLNVCGHKDLSPSECPGHLIEMVKIKCKYADNFKKRLL